MDNPSRREVIGLAVAGTFAIMPSPAEGSDEFKKDKPMNDLEKAVFDDMAKRAKAISEKAYCPYSKFRVGAVVLTEDGKHFEGCNVENASYGLTICAERNAIFHMVAQSKLKIRAIVIYTATPKPAAPCGACRQVINEFGPDAIVISVCDGPDVLRKKLSELLPDAFGPANLEK